MKTFRLSNTTDSVMLVAFEPIGNIFSLPVKENLQVIVFDDSVGLGVDSLEIEVQVVNGNTTVTIWAEKDSFEVRYKGDLIY